MKLLDFFPIIEAARFRAMRAVNAEMIQMYWELGAYVSARVKDGGWGKFDKTQTTLIACVVPFQGNYTIPSTVTEIESYAFEECESLTGISIPDSVKYIDSHAFRFCTGLTELTIPDSVKQIGWDAFDCCNGLKTVRLGKGLQYIDSDAFDECLNLENVVVSCNTDFYFSAVFDFCPKLKTVLFEQGPPKVYYRNENINGPVFYYDPKVSGWTDSEYYNAAEQTFGGYRLRTWDPSSPAGKFLDVGQNVWYRSAVEYCVQNELFNGTGEFAFSPENTMTRAMLVTVLWRNAGEPKQGSNSFNDVPDGTWYTDAVTWAAANGIVKGVAEGRFNPNGTLSREQLATILMRYSLSEGNQTNTRGNLDIFPDAGQVSNFARDSLAWAVGEGLINGIRSNGVDYLRPQGGATRAQVAAILMRYLEKN